MTSWGNAGNAKKKKSGGGGFFGSIEHGLSHAYHDTTHVLSGTGRGFYHAATGLPTGLYMGGRMVGSDIKDVIEHPMHPHWKHTRALAKAIAKSEYEQYRHFGRGGDVSGPITDALAILSGGGAAVGKARAVSEAAKAGEGLTGALRAVSRPRAYDRLIPGTDHRIPASPNPLMRAGQNLALKNDKVAAKALKRVETERERYQRQLTAGTKSTPYTGPVILPPGVAHKVETAKVANKRAVGIGKTLINTPMDALRLTMWMRPRYYIQNLTQTGAMLGANPILTTKNIARAAKLRKENPKLYEDLKNVVGEGQALALMESRLGAGGKLSDFMYKAGRAANAPEAHVRVVSILNEMKKAKIHSTPEMERIIRDLKTGKPSNRALNIARRSNENVGDFGRLSKKERTFIKIQLPIFYPMFKALTRYGYRQPFEHSIQTAAGLHLGNVGKEEQKRLLGDLPFWAQYLIPTGAGDPNAKSGPQNAVLNPANIYNLQPAIDLTRQAVEPFRKGGPNPGINLLQESGPAGQILFGMATGKDLQTGYPIKGPTGRSIFDAPAKFFGGLPLTDIGRLATGKKPHLRSYAPGYDRLLNEMLGPAIVSRKLIKKETTKQAKREKRYGHGRKHRQKHYRDTP